MLQISWFFLFNLFGLIFFLQFLSGFCSVATVNKLQASFKMCLKMWKRFKDLCGFFNIHIPFACGAQLCVASFYTFSIYHFLHRCYFNSLNCVWNWYFYVCVVKSTLLKIMHDFWFFCISWKQENAITVSLKLWLVKRLLPSVSIIADANANTPWCMQNNKHTCFYSGCRLFCLISASQFTCAV